MLAQQKTNSNCSTAALAVYSLLFSASYNLHRNSLSYGTLQEERVYWYGHVAACGSGLLQHGLNLHNMVYHETEQPRKRLEASINAEDGHSDTTNLQSDEKV